MFALRMTEDGKTEGYAIAFTKRRHSLNALINGIVLWLTKVAGLYFANGDTQIFQTIRFHLKTPVAADRAVLSFIHHLEQQVRFPVSGNCVETEQSVEIIRPGDDAVNRAVAVASGRFIE